jgi:YVTN family beta-propeller protein
MSISEVARGIASRPRTVAIGVSLAVATGVAVAVLPTGTTVGPRPDGTAYTSYGWRVAPAGTQIPLGDRTPADANKVGSTNIYGDRPYGMVASPDERFLLVSNDGQSVNSLMVVDRAAKKVVQTIRYDTPEALFHGLVYSPNGKRAYAAAGPNDLVRAYDVDTATGKLTETAPIVLAPKKDGKYTGSVYPAGLAISADGGTLYSTNLQDESVSIIDATTATVKKTAKVGHNPYDIVLSDDGATAYVSNWGGTVTLATKTEGQKAKRPGTVSVVDTASGKEEFMVGVGTHPSAMAIDRAHDLLYVANSDSDNISVIDTTSNEVKKTVSLAPYKGAPVGTSPNAIAVAPGGAKIYVANAGNNDLAVVNTTELIDAEDGGRARVSGLIPTGWFPAAVTVSSSGDQIIVANAKGLGSGPNDKPGPNPTSATPTAPNQYNGSMMNATLSFIPTPTGDQLRDYTRQVSADNGFTRGTTVDAAPDAGAADVIPRRPGGKSTIKHVIYVVKENRTFDQVYGDFGKVNGANGDPKLLLFDDKSAPNQRKLAKDFVTLDNLYSSGEVSADGWNWVVQSEANTFVQKGWPANYGGRARGYEWEGGTFATSAARDPENSYIWDRLARKRVGFRNYGFFQDGSQAVDTAGVGVYDAAKRPVYNVAQTEPELAVNTDLNFPGYNLTITDQVRVAEWKREFDAYVAKTKDTGKDSLPTVQFVRLPNDRANQPTPAAMVADNDLAVGKLVDAVSHSPFWKDTAIFIIEDDAQDGPDHVDGHRMTGLVVSPYARRGARDSNLYTTVSVMRTIELITGLGPLTQFDAAAPPMIASFTTTPDATPYTLITPSQALDQKNPPAAVQAELRPGRRPVAPAGDEEDGINAVDFHRADAGPEQVLNAQIWKSVKGPKVPMPAPKHTVIKTAG